MAVSFPRFLDLWPHPSSLCPGLYIAPLLLTVLLCMSLSFWLCWVFVAACRLPLVAVSRGYSLAAMGGLLITVASLVEHRHETVLALVVVVCGRHSSDSESRVQAQQLWRLD